MTWRRPVWALYALVVGLALHNIVMAMLWRAGVRGGALTVISAWKELLLLAALALVVAERRALPFSRSNLADVLALAFGVFVVVYALIPQSVLDGHATHKGIAYALRHDLLIVGAYFLGRGLALTDRERARLCHVVLATAASVAVLGLVDVYAVSLAWWRLSAGTNSSAHGRGLSLPQNFVYNAANVVFDSPPRSCRRWRPACSSSRCSSSAPRRGLPSHCCSRDPGTHAPADRARRGLIVLALVRRRFTSSAGRQRSLVVAFVGLRPLRAAHISCGRAWCRSSTVLEPERVARPDRGGRVVDARAPYEPARRREDGAETSVSLGSATPA